MAAQQVPPNPMKSTWRNDRSQWNYVHWFYEIFSLHPSYLEKEPPKHPKTDSVPYLPDWQATRWVLFHASIPLGLHQAFAYLTGRNLDPVAAFLFYSVAFKLISLHELHQLRQLGVIYGFFDGDKHGRDEVPDVRVHKVLRSLIATSTFRPMMAVIFSYQRNLTPASIDFLWLPLKIGIYGIVLDFWFYWYHRVMHDFDYLWPYHRTHHLTKHPNPLLTLFADEEQELFDIAGIPLMTWITMNFMGLHMGFYEWYICLEFVVFPELSGHSGLRVVTCPPSPLSWLLRLIGAELLVEDHDLHHRKGYRRSGNYGKQTRLWDIIFGTCYDRIECVPDNIDYQNVVNLPLFSYPTPLKS